MKNGIKIIGSDMPIFGINKEINPKNDSKFSPNLYKFLTYGKKHFTNVFQDPKTGYYHIGLKSDNNIFCGNLLMNVFCVGTKSKSWSYPRNEVSTWVDVTKWFWETYLKIGKQIYDLPEWKTINIKTISSI